MLLITLLIVRYHGFFDFRTPKDITRLGHMQSVVQEIGFGILARILFEDDARVYDLQIIVRFGILDHEIVRLVDRGLMRSVIPRNVIDQDKMNGRVGQTIVQMLEKFDEILRRLIARTGRRRGGYRE